MEKLQELLQRARNGNAVLFCGAGLTADCLNFDEDSTVGVTFHLLRLLNDELKANGKQSGFRDIRNAAKRYRSDLGNHRLMQLLKDRFRLKNVSSSIVDIVGYPWAAVYTTNYDNGLELALQEAGKKCASLNNLDDPKTTSSGTPIIHLHGFIDAWTDATFDQSCILDADSYRHLSGVSNWLSRLRFDLECAEVVVFIGFSAADFHLSQVFFDSSGLREKAFFINRPSSEPDLDERMTQEEFGEPLYIGRQDFAQIVRETLQLEGAVEPKLASFNRYRPPLPSVSVPSVQDIEDLFIWGRVVEEHLKRDYDQSKSDYHVRRQEVEHIRKHLDSDGRIVLLSGDICAGKKLVVWGAVNGLSAGRPVFQLRHSYSGLVDEACSILTSYPNAVLVVDNCFSLHKSHLLGLARQISASAGALILSSRNISTEAETGKLKDLRAIPSLLEIDTGRLHSAEVDALIALIDQIAGWRDFRALSLSDRRRFVEVECNGVIPSVLLRLLKSDYVRMKYREEYNKTSHLDDHDRQMIIAALLIANIGFDAPISLLSDLFEQDFISVLKRASIQGSALKLVRADAGVVRTVPSVGARDLLESIIEARDIVNTTIYILERMEEEIKRSDLQQHIFLQLMRYSILSTIVSDKAEINRFFDHISKIRYFREMPLFWLQWHMAVCAEERWPKAEEYLEMGYTAAKGYEKRKGEEYNKKQLDDRKAKFLIARAVSQMRSGPDLFRDMKTAIDIVGRLINGSELTHHPYETLLEISNAFRLRSSTLLEVQSTILAQNLGFIFAKAKSRLGNIPEGYQRSHADDSIKRIAVILAK